MRIWRDESMLPRERRKRVRGPGRLCAVHERGTQGEGEHREQDLAGEGRGESEWQRRELDRGHRADLTETRREHAAVQD